MSILNWPRKLDLKSLTLRRAQNVTVIFILHMYNIR